MSEERIRFDPDVQGTIAGTRSRSMEWRDILGELIDNAFDAGATRVEIIVSGREITIEDDGVGCDDLEKMLTMGRHSRKVTTRLGRYGVGLKDAAWWVGGPTLIVTIHNGTRRRIRLDWDRMTEWSAPAPLVEKTDKRGTSIRFEAIGKERRFPDGERLEKLLAELAFTYTPALKDNRQIVFRRGRGEPVILQRFRLPAPLIDVVDTDIEVDGKIAHVHVGIVPEGVDNPRPGISYTHGFRVITHGALGCSGHGSRNIAGWVRLGEGWTLSRNKDDVSAYKEELGQAVFDAICSIVTKASRQAMSMRTAALSSDLTSMFRNIIGGSEDDAKAKRDPKKNETGGVRPTVSGKKHERAKKTQSGSSFPRVKAGHFSIEFGTRDDDAIGHVDLDGRTIWLSESHPTIKQARDQQNPDKRALLVAAVFLFAVRDCDSPTSLLSIVRDGSVARNVELIVGKLLLEIDAVTAELKAVA